MEILVQNKEFILLLASIIGIIFYFRSLSKDFHTEIKTLETNFDSKIDGVHTRIDNLSQTMNDQINDLSQTMNNRMDSLYNLLATQGKLK